VLGYLRQKFEDIEAHETPSGSCEITVSEDGDYWRVNVSEEFVSSHDAEAARELVEDWNLAGEMRRAEGLGLMVSSAGVRLESSN